MFFSVKVPMKIGNKKYRTCVCYELPKLLEETVKKLEKEGKASIYEKEVFFCNGKLVELKKEPVAVKKEEPVEALAEEIVEVKAVEKSSKKKRRDPESF